MYRIPSLALLLLAAGPALAAKLPEVAVAGVHVEGLDAAEGEAASARFGEILTATGVLAYVEPQRVSARLKGREDLVLAEMALDEGRTRLEEGRVLYERAQPDGAIPLLEQATRELEAGIQASGRTRELIDAWLLLGLSHTGMGDEAAARAAFREVVVLDPARELDPISYPPTVIEWFSGVRAEVLGLRGGAVEIELAGDYTEVEVFVDGLSRGTGPVTVEDLPPGGHHIFVVADGGRRAYQAVEVLPGQPQRATLTLQSAIIASPAPDAEGRAAQVERLYRALGEHASTQLLLIAGQVDEDEVALQLYSPRTGNFSRALSSRFEGDPVEAMALLMPAMASFVTEAGDIKPEAVSPRVTPLDVSANAVLTQVLLDPNEELQVQYIEQGGGRWWLWAGLGAVVAGGGATTAALLLAGEPEPEGTISFGPIP